MRSLHATLLATLFICSGLGLYAEPSTLPAKSSLAVLPIPPTSGGDPPPVPPLPRQGLAEQVKSAARRCAAEKFHRAHAWQDASGQVCYCQG